jgi:hypothetical protein
MTPKDRRHLLIKEMEELELQGKSCKGCEGTCCTYEANSMMVTPLETLDLFNYLKENSLLTHELKQKLQATIKLYRLDQTISTGKRSLLRRTYTCSFFNHHELGCPLPREVKPYGCLGFNSRHVELKKGEYCSSDKSALEIREKQFDEESSNRKISAEKKLTWEKAPLPVALLDFWNSDQ